MTAGSTPRPAGLSTRSWVALVLTAAAAVLLLALALGGGAPQPVPAGLPDAGAPSRWLLELARFVSRVAAVGTVGCLLVAAVLAPSDGRSLSVAALRGLRLAGVAGLTWAGSGLAEYVLHVADLTGTAVTGLGARALTERLVTTPEGITTLLVVTLALHVGAHALAARTPATAALLLVGALAAVVPQVAVGHVQSSPDPGLAASATALHVVTATVWVGGLAALVLLLRREPQALAVAARRFSAVALVCYAGLVLSGVLAAMGRITSPGQLLTSPYGLLLVLKSVLAVGLGVAGGLHRAQTVQALSAHPTHGRAFLRLAVGEVVAMTVALALAVALASTPPPGGTSDAWRPDALVTFAALLAAGGYLVGTALLDAGPRWSRWRTAGFLGGVVVAACALSVDWPGSAASLLGQHLVLVGLSGPLLALGNPLQLARRALPAAGPGAPAGLREALTATAPLARVAPGWWALGLLTPCLLVVGTGIRPQHQLHLLLCLSSVVGGTLLAAALTATAPAVRTRVLAAPCAGLLLVTALLARTSEQDAAELALGATLLAVTAVLLRVGWRRSADVGPRQTQVLVTRG